MVIIQKAFQPKQLAQIIAEVAHHPTDLLHDVTTHPVSIFTELFMHVPFELSDTAWILPNWAA